MVPCLPRRSCEAGYVTYTSTSCGVAIASLSECLVCKSKCMEYSGKDDKHVAVAIFFSATISILAMVQSPITICNKSDSLKIDELTFYPLSRLDPALNFLKWT